MIEPALTPEQWLEWQDGKHSKRLSANVLSRGEFAHTIVWQDDAFLRTDVSTPAEYRAAIAVLLDALAQAGEPLLTREDVETLQHAKEMALAEELPMQAAEMGDILSRIASLLPPDTLRVSGAPAKYGTLKGLTRTPGDE